MHTCTGTPDGQVFLIWPQGLATSDASEAIWTGIEPGGSGRGRMSRLLPGLRMWAQCSMATGGSAPSPSHSLSVSFSLSLSLSLALSLSLSLSLSLPLSVRVDHRREKVGARRVHRHEKEFMRGLECLSSDWCTWLRENATMSCWEKRSLGGSNSRP